MTLRTMYWTASMVWHWEDAPPHLKALLPPGRRGQNVALVPRERADDARRWQKALGQTVSRHPLTDGDLCLIGAELVDSDATDPAA